jgi:hypothetical protein
MTLKVYENSWLDHQSRFSRNVNLSHDVIRAVLLGPRSPLIPGDFSCMPPERKDQRDHY